jgi:uncharacterized repeat protein (TIGR03803 family)
MKLLLGIVAAMAVSLAISSRAALSLETLHSFCSEPNCADGATPYSGLIMNKSGNLYGTTSSGGAYNHGAVFELSRNAATGSWTNKLLYSFCSLGKGCRDGSDPRAGLITDALGNLYGTTAGGGTGNDGTAFELSRNAAAGPWKEQVLYSFCPRGGWSCPGGTPPSGLVRDEAGDLYGTTLQSGPNDRGTVFELTPGAVEGTWTEKVLYSFCAQKNCADGTFPYSGLIRDGSGRLYGTTSLGGAIDGGTVFELTPNSSQTEWTTKILYRFCSARPCLVGSQSHADLVMDASGNLYGTAFMGGAKSGGTVFELSPNAAKTLWTAKPLYSFCSQVRCADGAAPAARLVMDASGNLYGTTFEGGAKGEGAVFELRPNSARNSWTETVLYSFCLQGNPCVDGSAPLAGLIMDASGNLFGTTSKGGAKGKGTVFELKVSGEKTERR